MDAEPYLRQILVTELGSPKVVAVNDNPQVVNLIKQRNEEGCQELMSYGVAQVEFFQSAVTAIVKWADGDEGIVICGVSSIKSIVPNA
ncbi:MAG: hypothetical protein ACOH2A_03775 [Sphingobacteriaceae bacterium]